MTGPPADPHVAPGTGQRALMRLVSAVAERARESRRGGGSARRVAGPPNRACVLAADAPSLAGSRDVDRFVYNAAEHHPECDSHRTLWCTCYGLPIKLAPAPVQADSENPTATSPGEAGGVARSQSQPSSAKPGGRE